MPRQKVPRPAALSEISDAFDALMRNECYPTSATVAIWLDAVDRLRTLAPKLEPESEEARVIAPVLAYLEAEGTRYAGMSLGDAIAAAVTSYERLSVAERRKFEHRAWEGVGRLQERADNAKRRSNSGREGAAETEKVQFNYRVEEALAEVPLPPGKRRSVTAMAHLKNKHVHLWKARAPRSGLSVGQRIKSTWFKDRMTASQKLRAKKLEAEQTQSVE